MKNLLVLFEERLWPRKELFNEGYEALQILLFFLHSMYVIFVTFGFISKVTLKP